MKQAKKIETMLTDESDLTHIPRIDPVLHVFARAVDLTTEGERERHQEAQ